MAGPRNLLSDALFPPHPIYNWNIPHFFHDFLSFTTSVLLSFRSMQPILCWDTFSRNRAEISSNILPSVIRNMSGWHILTWNDTNWQKYQNRKVDRLYAAYFLHYLTILFDRRNLFSIEIYSRKLREMNGDGLERTVGQIKGFSLKVLLFNKI
jgi:hypothetical protein